MKNRNVMYKLVKFFKIYSVFMAIALVVNLSMEMLIPTPEEKNALAIVVFYLLFNLLGSSIFLFKNYRPAKRAALKMGTMSFALGFIFEFTFMRPDWVRSIFALSIGGDVVSAVIVSAIYWFIAWGLPAYIIRYLKIY